MQLKTDMPVLGLAGCHLREIEMVLQVRHQASLVIS